MWLIGSSTATVGAASSIKNEGGTRNTPPVASVATAEVSYLQGLGELKASWKSSMHNLP